ncbi:hypothetical protein OZX67_03975 [Bifidobacterium sp. ESL0728]|uniref:hypothetical protein n=1 Tax=Bifidobacterium sp. ESL0728 TaxID=2983220 RepID=UPI0023F90B17|nr:hypothetical protein [Bifidobacterium sp. ESL0728]WEV59705.1 hypothetical protein OZX67_03975 [Bifidobacterium sp. ESL0728]
MMGRYSNDYLENLYNLARKDGCETLTPAERLALGRWCRKNGKTIPGEIPTKQDKSAGTVPPQPVQDKPADTKGTPKLVKPAEATVQAPKPKEADADGLEWVGDDWPEGAVECEPKRGRWWSVAEALTDHRGRVAMVESGLARERARDLATRIRTGHLHSFAPKGSFEARYIRRDGKYSVLARYVGGEPDGR